VRATVPIGTKTVFAVIACIAILHVNRATAESCEKSLNYILDYASDDLPQRADFYRTDLYKSCLRTLQLSNVADAFVLKVGAIAVLPRIDSVRATAGTLAQFCVLFPRLTLRFIRRQEKRIADNISRVVELPVTSTPCEKIIDNG
jgi:hypothetical protein